MRLWLKILMVGAMTLAILLPLLLIRGTIHERQAYRHAAVRDVAASFGGAQVFGGPVLVVPYTEAVEEEVLQDGVARTLVRRRSASWTFSPKPCPSRAPCSRTRAGAGCTKCACTSGTAWRMRGSKCSCPRLPRARPRGRSGSPG